MQVIDLSRLVKTYVADLLHTGTEVFILRAHNPNDDPIMGHWLVDVVDVATGRSWSGRPGAFTITADDCVLVGPRTYAANGTRDLGMHEIQTLDYGTRYPNVSGIGLLNTESGIKGWRSPAPVAIRCPLGPISPMSPVQTELSRGKRGVVRCRPISPSYHAFGSRNRVATRNMEEVNAVVVFNDRWADDPFEPESLLVPAPDPNTVYRFHRTTSGHDVVTLWDLSRPAGARCVRQIPLYQPPAGKKWTQRFIDAKLSPDTNKMFVSWANHDGKDGSRLAIYETEDFDILATFDIPAGYLAPSPDGLTLAVLSGVGGRLSKTQLRIIDLD